MRQDAAPLARRNRRVNRRCRGGRERRGIGLMINRSRPVVILATALALGGGSAMAQFGGLFDPPRPPSNVPVRPPPPQPSQPPPPTQLAPQPLPPPGPPGRIQSEELPAP